MWWFLSHPFVLITPHSPYLYLIWCLPTLRLALLFMGDYIACLHQGLSHYYSFFLELISLKDTYVKVFSWHMSFLNCCFHRVHLWWLNLKFLSTNFRDSSLCFLKHSFGFWLEIILFTCLLTRNILLFFPQLFPLNVWCVRIVTSFVRTNLVLNKYLVNKRRHSTD